MRGDADRHVTLSVPGLLGPPPVHGAGHDEAARLLCEGVSPRALERFLGRATRERSTSMGEGLAAMLFGCFGVAKDGPDWPVAAVTRAADAGGVETRCVLRVDPVHLRASMGDLVLADDASLRISAPEAAALAAEINAELDEPDLCIEPLAPKRWYLCLDEPPRLVTRAPWELVGVAIPDDVPGGDDGARWRALVNDIQMILHASPINRAREGRGEATVNSVWLWGGGRAPRVARSLWQAVWTDETLAEGLARLAGTASRPLPDNAREWLAQAQTPGRHLVVVSEGYGATGAFDVDDWRRFIDRLDGTWVAPLVDALDSGELSGVALQTGGPLDFRLARQRLGHWWRRPLPFARMLATSRRLASQQS